LPNEKSYDQSKSSEKKTIWNNFSILELKDCEMGSGTEAVFVYATLSRTRATKSLL